MYIKLFFSAFLAFTALVNPIQKVFVVFSLQKQFSAEELKRIMNRATLTATGILVLFFVMGEAILGYIFNLELYAFQIACGIVLFYNGFIGLQKGFFFSPDEYTRMEDIIAVPFAVPMIAGPATITAVVSMPAVYGRMITLTAMLAAILLNLIVMRHAGRIGQVLVKRNILMPMIRITGLIVAAIGLQMALNGIHSYVNAF